LFFSQPLLLPLKKLTVLLLKLFSTRDRYRLPCWAKGTKNMDIEA